MQYLNKSFTVAMTGKDYENNFDRIFRKSKNEENDTSDRERKPEEKNTED